MLKKKEVKKNRRAVVVIYSNKSLYDFLWYYSTYGQGYLWTAIVQYYGVKENQELLGVCKQLEIFESVLQCNDDYSSLKLYEQIYEMVKMTWYYILGKRNQYFSKIIKKYVEDYDLSVVGCDHMLIHAAFISMGDEKETIILEDGLGDYLKRYNHLNGKITDIYNLAAFLCAKMGYFNFKMCYALPTTKQCTKYSKNPKKMKYRNYKSIQKLQDFSNTDNILFQQLLRKWIGKLPEKFSGEAIFFTSVLSEFMEDADIQTQKSIEYINNHFEGKTIFLKKHPRDTYIYKFSDSIKVIELSSQIPAEVLSEMLDTDIAVFMNMSAVMLLKEEYQKNGLVLHFRNYKQKSNKISYEETFRRIKNQIGINEKQIVEIY